MDFRVKISRLGFRVNLSMQYNNQAIARFRVTPYSGEWVQNIKVSGLGLTVFGLQFRAEDRSTEGQSDSVPHHSIIAHLRH